jgi:hypothetical protein
MATEFQVRQQGSEGETTQGGMSKAMFEDYPINWQYGLFSLKGAHA